jgi:hypothetical protein
MAAIVILLLVIGGLIGLLVLISLSARGAAKRGERHLGEGIDVRSYQEGASIWLPGIPLGWAGRTTRSARRVKQQYHAYRAHRRRKLRKGHP